VSAATHQPRSTVEGFPLAPPGERVLIDVRPSLWYILVKGIPDSVPAVVLIVVVWLLRGLLVVSAGMLDAGLAVAINLWLGRLLAVLLLYVAVRFVWAGLDWFCRRYVLTDARAVALRGVLRTVRFDLPLRRVQHLAVTRDVLERIFGVGTISAASAGTGAHEIVWRSIARPEEALVAMRKRVDEVARRGDGPDPVPVIGLVGGVGSGKTAVAASFARLGCVVSDSDAAVRQVLGRKEVVDELVGWWGPGILDDQGGIDRKKVADKVFAEPFERRRLEALIHPLVRENRGVLIGRAREQHAGGVIVDAPLLFEAGVDAECDAIVFVEATFAARLGRVQEGRGWDQAELERREKAQMPLDEKRRRSDHVLTNNGTLAELESRVAKLLATIRKHSRDRA
jgi:dephospho-CoA kinase